MNESVVIFPNHLFQKHPALTKDRRVFLLEEERFFSAFRFHKKKLILHRASLKAYEERLAKRGYEIEYIEHDGEKTILNFFERLRKLKIERLYSAEIMDNELESRFYKTAQQYDVRVIVLPTPLFITPTSWISEFFQKTTHYSLTHFYIHQRKRLGILVEKTKPIGGKWSFDPENRKKIPQGMPIPPIKASKMNKFVEEATAYITNKFPDNPGSAETFIFPVTHEDAEEWLREFFHTRFAFYGDYQDAIKKDESFLFHSIISPALNIGLLEPEVVVSQALQFSEEYRIPLHTVEGFIRQIIGWREFVRAVYLMEGNKQRTTNFWRFERNLPAFFYNGTSGIEPLDNAISRLNKQAYLHHIERLMIIGNFALLCGINPDEIYRWFMEMFIDSYDWVMVPNVYGLSQYADGGLITTKPYISSSNYIRKMSDYSHGNWCEIWDALYWSFIKQNAKFFATNYRMSIMVRRLKGMGKKKLNLYETVADKYLEHL